MPDVKNLYTNLKRNVTKTSSGSEVCSYTSDLGKDSPILTLIHGYPQSAYEWRYMVPRLADKVSLFVPELPGYGVSTATKDHSKRGVGGALLEALQSVFNISEDSPRKVILGGHDRGGRICHRLAVDKDRYPALNVVGVIMLDIVPTKVQWEAFSNPAIATGYFHWPLLANVDFSVNMIKAYGGAQWCRDQHTRIRGPNDVGLQRIEADGALDLYASLFDREDVLRYSAEDYSAGAKVDVDEQAEDQKAGRKIEVPTLVMFSKARLGSRPDVVNVESVWKNWIKPGTPYEGIGVGGGYGHYLPEEAYEDVTEAVLTFLKRHA